MATKNKIWRVKEEFAGKIQIEDGNHTPVVLSNDLAPEVLEKLAQNEQTAYYLEKKTVSTHEQQQPEEN
ncbi:MAG: hypothetical protein U0X91_20760 [Spirosomataceae bacterium]